MEVQDLLDNIHELTDLELGVLLSLIAQSHCLMVTEDALIHDLASELSLIVSERFGLSCAILEPGDFSTAERFGEASLEQKGTQFSADEDDQPGTSRARLASLDFRATPRASHDDLSLDSRMIKNVIIAKDFNLADESVQVQAIEIITNKRFISRTTVHPAPKVFLFIPVIQASYRDVQLVPHLNDRIFTSHYHEPEDGFPYLEGLGPSPDSSSSPSQQHVSWESQQKSRRIGKNAIDDIRAMGEAAAITPEVRRYLQDIITFLRIERGVDGAITPGATTQFVALAKYLAPLHGINFVTPSLVALAARKVYPHRITIAESARERSMQYGSDLPAIDEILDGLTPQLIIESVLNTVQCPV